MTTRGPSPETEDASVLAVISAKGGSGTTAVAANLAGLIAAEARRRVTLVELDSAGGQLQRLFRLTAPPLLPSLAALPELSPELLAQAVDPEPGEVTVIATPSFPPAGTEPSGLFVQDLLRGLRSVTDTLVLDLGHRLGAVENAALAEADAVVVVTALSDLGVHATFGLRAALADLGVYRVVPVLNRTEANSDVDPGTVREALGREPGVHLPYDPTVVCACMNRGLLFVREHPAAQVTRRLRELAAMLVSMPALAEEGAEPRRGSHRETGQAQSRPRPRLFGLLDRAP